MVRFIDFYFHFLANFSSDLNFASYVLYNLSVLCHVSHTVSLGYPMFKHVKFTLYLQLLCPNVPNVKVTEIAKLALGHGYKAKFNPPNESSAPSI